MRTGTVMATLAAMLVVAGCGSDDSGAEQGETAFARKVAIHQSGYAPRHVKVLVGGNVTFVNRDPDELHAAETLNTSLPGQIGDQVQHEEDYSFDTFTLTWGEPKTIEFNQPGTFEYYCPFDAGMTGKVEVVERKPPKGDG